MKQIADYITSIPDYPEPGIVFRDITTLINDADGLRLAVDQMADCMKDIEFDVIAGLESRGFLFGMPIAYKLGKPFVLIRKKGKLPRATVSAGYALEYGTAEIELHRDDLRPGTRVVLVDDLIATGGTLEAAVRLIEQVDSRVVKIVCLLELEGLHGRDRLQSCPVQSVVRYQD